MGQFDSSARLQGLLDLHRAGHDSARNALLQHSLERCRILTRLMFRPHAPLRALDESDDVLQKALVRLYRALARVKPPTVRAFFGLAARQIRWVLMDLAQRAAAKVSLYAAEPFPPGQPEDGSGRPCDLAEWGEFHEKIEALPEEERELFDLLFYQGLTQAEAAVFLRTSLRTVKRRWARAKLLLFEALRGEWPSLEGDR